MDEERHDSRPESAEGEKASELSEKVPEEISGEGATPWGSSAEHSRAPGPHGTGEVYPRGDRSDEDKPEAPSDEERTS